MRVHVYIPNVDLNDTPYHGDEIVIITRNYELDYGRIYNLRALIDKLLETNLILTTSSRLTDDTKSRFSCMSGINIVCINSNQFSIEYK